jgi:hypothetical protein
MKMSDALAYLFDEAKGDLGKMRDIQSMTNTAFGLADLEKIEDRLWAAHVFIIFIFGCRNTFSCDDSVIIVERFRRMEFTTDDMIQGVQGSPINKLKLTIAKNDFTDWHKKNTSCVTDECTAIGCRLVYLDGLMRGC